MRTPISTATHIMKRLVVSCSALLLTGAALAQTTLYRCGADGGSYSQTPCANGRALVVDDTRSPVQQQQALSAAHREQTLAQQLRDQRLADEARFKPTGPAGIRYAAADAARATPSPAATDRLGKHPRKSAEDRLSKKDPRLTWQVKLPAPKKEKANRSAASVKR